MKIHQVEKNDMNNNSRIIRVETVIEHITYVLDRIDKKFDLMDQKIDKNHEIFEQAFIRLDEKMQVGFRLVDQKIDKVQEEAKKSFKEVNQKIDTNFKWIVGMMITLFVLNGFVPAITKVITNLIPG